MSQWNHSICDACWNKEEPNRKPKRAPYLSDEPPVEVCCFCGKETQSGIHYVHRPSGLFCKGECAVQDYPADTKEKATKETEAILATQHKDWAELNRIMERLSLHELQELSLVAEQLHRHVWGMVLLRRDLGQEAPIT